MKEGHPSRILAVVPHPDDFEFNLGGLFALMRKFWGESVKLKILIVSTGATGHHILPPEETILRRQGEARQAAEILGVDVDFLRGLDGALITTQVLLTRNILGGLWNRIRQFAPDILFCPPVASDPLAGIHVDHEMTAQAIRHVTYQLSVPKAYPHQGPSKPTLVRAPLVINCDDTYCQPREWHFQADISSVYSTKEAMALCHESQIFEWLPHLSGRSGATSQEFVETFQARHKHVNHRYGDSSGVPKEYFRITRWGRAISKVGELDFLLPFCQIHPNFSP